MLSFVFALGWSTGQIIFLGAFFAVVAIIVATLAASALRTLRAMKTNQADAIRWKADFHDLSPAARTCRHEFTGEFKHRVCTNDFDCNVCEQHAKLLANRAAAPVQADVQVNPGFTLPLDRLYHRGHTWTKQDPDGTYIIGIDDFAARLIGTPDGINLPAIGTRVSANGSAWNFTKGDATVRLLSPIAGEVVGTNDGTEGWYVRVKPLSAAVNTGHLLRGNEVAPWIQREFERLQNFLADPKIGFTLPDGGVPITDFSAAFPEKDWEAIYGSLLLEP
jgi:glycine cleavage system H lipoate-binding protein